MGQAFLWMATIIFGAFLALGTIVGSQWEALRPQTTAVEIRRQELENQLLEQHLRQETEIATAQAQALAQREADETAALAEQLRAETQAIQAQKANDVALQRRLHTIQIDASELFLYTLAVIPIALAIVIIVAGSYFGIRYTRYRFDLPGAQSVPLPRISPSKAGWSVYTNPEVQSNDRKHYAGGGGVRPRHRNGTASTTPTRPMQ